MEFVDSLAGRLAIIEPDLGRRGISVFKPSVVGVEAPLLDV